MKSVRNILTVIIITCLIWLFAEAESLRTIESPADIVFSAETGGDRSIDVLEPPGTGPLGASVRVLVDLEGSTAAMEAAERILRRPITLTTGMEGVPREPGDRTISLRDALRNHPDLRTRGITVKRVDPAEVRLFVDEIEVKTVKVQTAIPLEELDGAVEVRPATITLRLPSSKAKLLTENSAAIATIDPAALAALQRGRRQSLPGVPIALPQELVGASHITMDTRTADVSLMLRTQTRVVKLPSVPVHVRIAPGELGKWDIEIPEQDRFLTDVTISGPNDKVKAVEDGLTSILATVSLSFEELEKPVVSKEAVFADLPEGLKADAANRSVRLTIKRRAAERKPPT